MAVFNYESFPQNTGSGTSISEGYVDLETVDSEGGSCVVLLNGLWDTEAGVGINPGVIYGAYGPISGDRNSWKIGDGNEIYFAWTVVDYGNGNLEVECRWEDEDAQYTDVVSYEDRPPFFLVTTVGPKLKILTTWKEIAPYTSWDDK